MTNDFGLVTEGITDQIVLESILFGFFQNDDLAVMVHQPLLDETDRNKVQEGSFGGWGNLINYCKSQQFRNIFSTTEYVIIQIDTDQSHEFGVPHNEGSGELPIEALVEKVCAKIISWINAMDEAEEGFFEKVQDRVLFAISVHSVECWFLPLYFTDNRKSKIANCLNSLNTELNKKHSFTIDPNRKNPEYYRVISKPLEKPKNQKTCRQSPSFDLFFRQLEPLKERFSRSEIE